MLPILLYKTIHPLSEPVSLPNGYAAVEYLYRIEAEAMLWNVPASDSEILEVLMLLQLLPVRRLPRLFLLVSRPLPFRLPELVEYCFQGPVDPETILKRIVDAPPNEALYREPESMRDRHCSALLLRLGVAPHLQGFEILRLALLYLLGTPNPTEVRVMQELYPLLAAATGSTASVVEHAMRAAIETAWLRADLNELDAFFGYTTNTNKATPSNSAFLFALMERIRARMDGQSDGVIREMRRLEQQGLKARLTGTTR